MSEFNPYGLHAIHIPLGMLAYPSLTWGAKCLYGRLALHLGKPREGAHCDPDLDTLASEMGVSIDTIDRWIKELTDEKFIERKRRGPRTAECIFLQHPCLSNSATLRNKDTDLIPQPCGVKDSLDSASVRKRLRNHAEMIPQTGAFCGDVSLYENIHENIHEDIQSSKSVPAVVDPVSNDDDSTFSSEKKKEEGSSSLARKMYGNGKGQNLPEKENPAPDEKAALVEDSRDALRASIASVKSASEGITQAEALKATTAPDREITLDILEAFHALDTDAGQDDFTAWLNGTEDRALALKARDPGAVYALYRTDARKRAPDIAEDRVKEQKRRADEETAAEQERAAEAERQRIAHVAMEPARAIELVEADTAAIRPFVNVPKILKRHLIRIGKEITPYALAEIVRSGLHRSCDRCEKTGLVGSTIERTRQFCYCLWGTELEHEDPQRPAREIEYAHVNVKNKLVAAAREAHHEFLGDCLEVCTITETELELILDAPKENRLFFGTWPDLANVLKVAGEQRAVRLAWKAAA